MRYVVIGNGIGGITAARELIKKTTPDSEVLIFSIESWGYYPRPKLPYFLEDHKIAPEKLIVYDKKWYEATNIDLHLSEKILEISTNKKEITSGKGVYRYDRLLLSLGATPSNICALRDSSFCLTLSRGLVCFVDSK